MEKTKKATPQMNSGTNEYTESQKKAAKRERIRSFWKMVFKRRVAVLGAIGVIFFILVALFANFISPYDPNVTDPYNINLPPSMAHWMGTDNFGRDVLTRMIYGSRVSLIIGVGAVVIACCIGVFLGLCCAYFRSWVDVCVMRFCESLNAIPNTVLTMSLTAIFGTGLKNLAIILGVSLIPSFVRMMRAQALSVSRQDYVSAGRVQGFGDFYLMFKHILPNAISPIIVMLTQQVGHTILLEAGISFLGVGIKVPNASWGSMINEGKDFLLTNPTPAIAPGVCIAILVICLNLLGDGLRDAMDPRLRGEV